MKPTHRALIVLAAVIALAGLVPVLRPGGVSERSESELPGAEPVRAQTSGSSRESAATGRARDAGNTPYAGTNRVLINVPDIEEAVEYYADNFEMTKGGYFMDNNEQVMELETGEVPNFGKVRAGDTVIGFYNDPGQDYASGSMSLMLRVDNIDQFRQRLVDRGVNASPPQPQPWGITVVYANDDFGNNISFFEPVEDDSSSGQSD